MGLYGNLATGNYLPYNVYYNKTSSVLFGSIKAFSSDKRFTDVNPTEGRKDFSLSIVLFSTLKRSNYRISLNEAIQCSLYLLRRRAETGACLFACLFLLLWTTFSTQTSLVFSQTCRGCLRSLLSDQDSKAVHKRAQI